MGKILRLHLARVLPGSLIHIHRDQGGYVERGHRIHVPLQADPSTLAFLSCPTARPHAIPAAVTASEALQLGCLPLQIEEGLVSLSLRQLSLSTFWTVIIESTKRSLRLWSSSPGS